MNQAIIDRSNQYLVMKSLRIECYEGRNDIGEKVQVWEYGYKVPSNSLFTFRGYSVP